MYQPASIGHRPDGRGSSDQGHATVRREHRLLGRSKAACLSMPHLRGSEALA